MNDNREKNENQWEAPLNEEALSAVTGGLRSMDWRTCPACGYNGGGWSYTDGNTKLVCPQCRAKQSSF